VQADAAKGRICILAFCTVTVELLGGDCNEKPRLGAGRVASLAHLETIRKEVEAGWTMQAVYDTHGPKLGITYSQFIRYVCHKNGYG
jgi:hypothetical protein